MPRIKPHLSVEQIAKKHRVDPSFIEVQLKIGEKIEHEHTKDHNLAKYIALQHLGEIPDYYTRLIKMEKSSKKSQKGNKVVTEEKKGLWANIHARRKKGLPPKKPGQEGYPETLNIKEGIKQARKNVGASKCWTGKKLGNPPTKMKDGREVPNCVSEGSSVRYCPKCAKEETGSECKYGERYWDMFSLPISLGKKYDPNKPHPANEEKDHEYSMARSEISKIISAANRLKKKMGKGEGNIEAWVQSKITRAADYIDTAADYVDSGEMKKEDVSIEDAHGNLYAEIIDIIKPERLKASKGIGSEILGEGNPSFDITHSQADVRKAERAKKISALAQSGVGGEKANASRKGVSLPSIMVRTADSYEPDLKTFHQFMEDWQKVNRQDKTDGLSQKAVNAYRRENPGSKLKTAVTEKNPTGKRADRRSNFCSRMSGMKDKLTSEKTARDPDSNINKALRRWNCN